LIEKSSPIVLVESVKAGPEPLRAWLDERGYRVVDAGLNLLAIHRSDPTLSQLQIPETPAQSSAA
jgi:hypothetical protein